MKAGQDFVSMIALFGWGRHTDRLNSNYKPLTFGEIDDEARKFDDYSKTFDASKPGVIKLAFLVVRAEPEPYLDIIDKWYERDAGEQIGKYTLYKLKLR